MTQTNFIKSEIEKYIKFKFKGILTEFEIKKTINEALKEYSFSDNNEKILIPINNNIEVMGWSDFNGIYNLIDEDRDFDEKFQEEE